MNIRVKEFVAYKGHSISASGKVTVTFGAMYSELVNTIKLMQMLNNDIVVYAKLPESGPLKLGMFRLKQIVVDGDGESKIKFDGITDYIETDNLNMLPLNSDECKEFQIRCTAEIEEEGTQEDE